jgi:hypothetical protein
MKTGLNISIYTTKHCQAYGNVIGTEHCKILASVWEVTEVENAL